MSSSSRPVRSFGPSLLVRFAALSFVLVALLGVVLNARLATLIRERSIATNERNAAQVVDFVTDLASRAAVRNKDLPLSAQIELLKESFHAFAQAGGIVGVDSWNRQGRVGFSDDLSQLGRTSPSTRQRALALDGRRNSEVVTRSADPRVRALLDAHGPMLTVYVPVRSSVGAPVGAVAAVYMPYAGVEAAIDRDVRAVTGLLILGFAVLYVGLFHLVWRASRRLRRQAALNEELATHDALTGLPNRTLVQDRTEQALASAGRTGRYPALMLLDLDRFKEINDTLGHRHGDLLLRHVGNRLRESLRDTDTVARLGGDEFVVLLPHLTGPEAGLEIGRKLLAAVAEPFTLDDVTLDVEGSLGIALAPEHGTSFDDLLQHADVAMYAAKESHVGACLYEPAQDANSPRRLALLGELRRAMAEDQLVLHYQPKVRVDTGEVRGVEALVRWEHPQHGLVGPLEFIPAAERTGLIRPLTLNVLEQALGQVRAWTADGLDLRMAVNVSTRCLLDVDFPADVARLLDRSGVPAARLELEITESAIMTDPALALQILQRLATMGISLSLDDFGTGYSSMAYLQQLPVSQLKIDRSFVTDMGSRTSNAAIVRSSIDLARNLGLSIVAEGVETRQTWEQLADLHCDEAQGYYFARPMTADALTAWIASWDRDRQDVDTTA